MEERDAQNLVRTIKQRSSQLQQDLEDSKIIYRKGQQKNSINKFDAFPLNGSILTGQKDALSQPSSTPQIFQQFWSQQLYSGGGIQLTPNQSTHHSRTPSGILLSKQQASMSQNFLSGQESNEKLVKKIEFTSSKPEDMRSQQHFRPNIQEDIRSLSPINSTFHRQESIRSKEAQQNNPSTSSQFMSTPLEEEMKENMKPPSHFGKKQQQQSQQQQQQQQEVEEISNNKRRGSHNIPKKRVGSQNEQKNQQMIQNNRNDYYVDESNDLYQNNFEDEYQNEEQNQFMHRPNSNGNEGHVPITYQDSGAIKNIDILQPISFERQQQNVYIQKQNLLQQSNKQVFNNTALQRPKQQLQQSSLQFTHQQGKEKLKPSHNLMQQYYFQQQKQPQLFQNQEDLSLLEWQSAEISANNNILQTPVGRNNGPQSFTTPKIPQRSQNDIHSVSQMITPRPNNSNYFEDEDIISGGAKIASTHRTFGNRSSAHIAQQGMRNIQLPENNGGESEFLFNNYLSNMPSPIKKGNQNIPQFINDNLYQQRINFNNNNHNNNIIPNSNESSFFGMSGNNGNGYPHNKQASNQTIQNSSTSRNKNSVPLSNFQINSQNDLSSGNTPFQHTFSQGLLPNSKQEHYLQQEGYGPHSHSHPISQIIDPLTQRNENSQIQPTSKQNKSSLDSSLMTTRKTPIKNCSANKNQVIDSRIQVLEQQLQESKESSFRLEEEIKVTKEELEDYKRALIASVKKCKTLQQQLTSKGTDKLISFYKKQLDKEKYINSILKEQSNSIKKKFQKVVQIVQDHCLKSNQDLIDSEQQSHQLQLQNEFFREILQISSINSKICLKISDLLEKEEEKLFENEPLPNQEVRLEMHKKKQFIERIRCEDEFSNYENEIESTEDYLKQLMEVQREREENKLIEENNANSLFRQLLAPPNGFNNNSDMLDLYEDKNIEQNVTNPAAPLPQQSDEQQEDSSSEESVEIKSASTIDNTKNINCISSYNNNTSGKNTNHDHTNNNENNIKKQSDNSSSNHTSNHNLPASINQTNSNSSAPPQQKVIQQTPKSMISSVSLLTSSPFISSTSVLNSNFEAQQTSSSLTSFQPQNQNVGAALPKMQQRGNKSLFSAISAISQLPPSAKTPTSSPRKNDSTQPQQKGLFQSTNQAKLDNSNKESNSSQQLNNQGSQINDSPQLTQQDQTPLKTEINKPPLINSISIISSQMQNFNKIEQKKKEDDSIVLLPYYSLPPSPPPLDEMNNNISQQNKDNSNELDNKKTSEKEIISFKIPSYMKIKQ